MYISYILIAIVLLIVIGLFLQSIGINIIQYRAGAPGLIPLPGSFDARLVAHKTSDISGLLITDNTAFTVSVNFTITKEINQTNPEVILFYGRDSSLAGIPTPTIGTAKDTTVPHWSNGSDVSTLFTPNACLFSVWIDSPNSMNLIVQIYTASKPIPVTLQNPSIGVPIVLTLVFNKTYFEVYVNGKLTKTSLMTFPTIPANSISYNSSQGALYNPQVLSPDIAIKKVSVWNSVLRPNEINAIT